MEPILITEEQLENGVTLRLYDASRKLAGDRWLVALEACALVPVEENEFMEDDKTGDSFSVRQALGKQISFEQKRERFFIDERQKTSVFNQILESFRSSTRDYLAHPLFPSRFIRQSFRKYLEKKRLDELINTDRDG
jgi:hypothetical protein